MLLIFFIHYIVVFIPHNGEQKICKRNCQIQMLMVQI